LYRSRVEQIDDPDARLEGQPPWRLTLGAERQWAAGHGAGATLLHTPGFSTQQSDRQRLWRSTQTRLDAFVSWRQAGAGQWRLAVVNALAPAQRSRSALSAALMQQLHLELQLLLGNQALPCWCARMEEGERGAGGSGGQGGGSSGGAGYVRVVTYCA
jgi:hypothetical protein